MVGDHLNIILKEKPSLPPITIQDVVTKSYEVMNKLGWAYEDVRPKDKHQVGIFAAVAHQLGDIPSSIGPSRIISSLGDAIRDTVEGVGHAGTDLVGAIGDAVSETIDSTGNAVNQVESGFADVIKAWWPIILGGGLLLLLIAILAVIYKSRDHRKRPGFPQCSVLGDTTSLLIQERNEQWDMRCSLHCAKQTAQRQGSI